MSNTSLPIGLKKEEMQDFEDLIADFVGIRWHDNGTVSHYPSNLKMNMGVDCRSDLMFTKSWDWLMVAVDQIENYLFAVEIKENHCFISGYRKYEGFTILHKKALEGKKLATCKAVVQFIRWYNSQPIKTT